MRRSCLSRVWPTGPAALALVGSFACDVPTSAPVWDTQWSVVAGDFLLAASDLLPNVVEDGDTLLIVPAPPARHAFPLSRFCPACEAGADAQPGFTGVAAAVLSTTGLIVGADVTGGEIRLSLSHAWPFDPLRPTGAATGLIRIQALDSREPATRLAEAELDGALMDFPPGAEREVRMGVAPGTVVGSVHLRILLTTPPGPADALDPNAELVVEVGPSAITATSVDMAAEDAHGSVGPVALDLADVDPDIDEHLRAGAFLLTTENTLDLGLGGLLEVTPVGGPTIRKSIVVPKGRADQRIELTLEEVQAVVGSVVSIRASLAVQGAAGGVLRIEPGDRLEGTLGLEALITVGT